MPYLLVSILHQFVHQIEHFISVHGVAQDRIRLGEHARSYWRDVTAQAADIIDAFIRSLNSLPSAQSARSKDARRVGGQDLAIQFGLWLSLVERCVRDGLMRVFACCL